MRPLLLLLIVVLATLTGCRPYQYHGQYLDSPMTVPAVTLTNQLGQPASLADYRGKLVLVFFGYTFCPDVCPMTMSTAAKALDQLGNRADEVQMVLISVDPERDTPAALASYLSNFDPSFVGLTGTPDQIAAAALPLGIYYHKHEGTAATGYLVDHTASLMVLDREGRLRLLFPFDTPSEDIAADLRQLIK